MERHVTLSPYRLTTNVSGDYITDMGDFQSTSDRLFAREEVHCHYASGR